MLTNPQIQIALNKAGFGPVTVDGVIGPMTREAIKRFQRANKLMPDGIVGPKTDRALGAVYAALPPPQPRPPVETEEPMHFSERGMAMLGRSEGIRERAYLDTKNVVTIGIGATWGSGIFQEWWKKNRPGKTFDLNARMTRAEIEEVTRLMIDDEYGKAVSDELGNKRVPQHTFDAAVHAVYNMGPRAVKWRWFQEFKSGDYVGAASLLRTDYNKPPELFGRRQKEADLMEHGVYH